MNTLIAALSTLVLSFAGFTCLALAMDRHDEQVSGRASTTPARRRALRAGACVLGAAGLAACLQPWGPAVASLVWLGMLSCGAVGVTLTLSYRPRCLARAGCVAAIVGVGLAVVTGLAAV